MHLKMFFHKMRYVPAMLFVLIAAPIAHASTSPSLGDAATYSVLSHTGATNAGATTISGDVGVSPNNTYTENGSTSFLTVGNPHLNDVSAQNAQLANTAAFTSLGISNPDADCIGGVRALATDLKLMSPLPAGIAPAKQNVRFDIERFDF